MNKPTTIAQLQMAALTLLSAVITAPLTAQAQELVVVARTGTLDPRQGPNWDDRVFTSFELTTHLSRESSLALTIARSGVESGVFIVGLQAGPMMIANTTSSAQFGPQLGNTRRFRGFASTNGPTVNDIAIAASADAASTGSIKGHWKYNGQLHPVAIGGQTTDDAGCMVLTLPSEPIVATVGTRVVGRHECPSGPSITDSTQSDIRIAARDGTDGQAGPSLGLGVGFILNPGGSNEARLIPSSGLAAFYFASTTSGLQGIWRIDTPTNLPLAVSLLGPPLGPADHPGIFFQSFSQDRFASIDTNRIAFQSILGGQGVTTLNQSAIVRHESGINYLVARTGVDGDLGPRLRNGERFVSLAPATAIADPLYFPIAGTLSTDGRDGGIWIDRMSERHLVARTMRDDQFGPQLGQNVYFQQFNQYSILFGGDVIVHANIQGPGVSDSNNVGIWRMSTIAPPVLLLRSGQAIDVDPDVGVSLRIVRDFNASPALGWGQVTSAQIDQSGYLYFRLIFDGNEQAIALVRAGDQLVSSGFE